MATDKPRHRSGYTPDELEQVKSTCLTVAVTLGPYLGDIRIVGGLVPALLIDSRRGEDSRDHDLHPGTNDLDVGLALALLDERRYTEVSARLRAEGFQPDTNDRGAQTVQRWKLPKLNVTIDFLIPPTSDADDRVRVRESHANHPGLWPRRVRSAQRSWPRLSHTSPATSTAPQQSDRNAQHASP